MKNKLLSLGLLGVLTLLVLAPTAYSYSDSGMKVAPHIPDSSASGSIIPDSIIKTGGNDNGGTEDESDSKKSNSDESSGSCLTKIGADGRKMDLIMYRTLSPNAKLNKENLMKLRSNVKDAYMVEGDRYAIIINGQNCVAWDFDKKKITPENPVEITISDGTIRQSIERELLDVFWRWKKN